MLKFCSLYSGSSGNSFLVQSNNINLLVDAGASGKKISDALASLNVDINTISAILITHEHTDHTQSIAILSKKYNIPIYANKLTWDTMKDKKSKISKDNVFYFENNIPFKIKNLNIFPFDIPHDAANPCGFSISDGKNKLCIATDVGHITSDLLENLKNSNFILLESNYEPDILRYSRYPYKLKERISSPLGHLSNIEAGQAINFLTNYGVRNVMLGHLSSENNFPELAYKSVLEQIENKDLNLYVAKKFEPSEFFNVG